MLADVFAGVAARSLGAHHETNESSILQFSDFLFLIWPQYKFRKAKLNILQSRSS
jgi:hypothetical protein